MKKQLSTPEKIGNFFRDEVSPAGSKLDTQLLELAFGVLKKRYGSDFNHYIVYSAVDWAKNGGSELTEGNIKAIFAHTQPNPTVKKVKADKYAGMDPIPFDGEIDCGGPDR